LGSQAKRSEIGLRSSFHIREQNKDNQLSTIYMIFGIAHEVSEARY